MELPRRHSGVRISNSCRIENLTRAGAGLAGSQRYAYAYMNIDALCHCRTCERDTADHKNCIQKLLHSVHHSLLLSTQVPKSHRVIGHKLMWSILGRRIET